MRLIRQGDPALVPALAALALLVAWAVDQAGFPQTHWAPGGIVLLALLAIALGVAPARLATTPIAVRVAIGTLAAYSAFSFLSILWADVPGSAFEGADRTLLYLIVFALFAAWRRSAAAATLLLCVWVLSLAGLGVYTVLHVNASAGNAGALRALMPGGRLVFPAGYVNADAALWMMAFFPAWLLSSARRMPWAMRGLLAGAAVVLADVALYSQSRGSVYSIPIVLVLVFALMPGRVRALLSLLPIAAGAGAAAPAVLRMVERLEAGASAAPAIHPATLSVLLASALVAVFVPVAAAIDGRSKVDAPRRAQISRAIGAAAAIAVIVGVVAVIAVLGRPVGRVEHAWNTFTSIKGYEANSQHENRLVGGFGSNRYDFYRVAWHQFTAHPLLGIGADNFEQQYLRFGRSTETPHYPHSVELRTLTETGLVGAILALAGLIASLIAAGKAMRLPDSLARSATVAAVAGFAYWAIHGSFDWFYEYAGLGAAAFFLLGVACSLAPSREAVADRTTAVEGPFSSSAKAGAPVAARTTVVEGASSARAAAEAASAPAPPRVTVRGLPLRGLLAAAGALLLAAAVVFALGAPWLSRMDVQSAAAVWRSDPSVAYARLRQAESLNPLSAEPNLIAATIALRLGQLDRAEQQFQRALRRAPEDAYATLELGAIASSREERSRSLVLLRRAMRLNPRSQLVRESYRVARKERIDVVALNRSILREATRFS